MPKIFLLLFCVFCLKLQAVKYYLNDASVTNDIFCTAPGNAANNGLSPSTPKLTLASILSTYSASFSFGDTILIDAGNYTEIQLSSPINGVVIRGAGVIKTVITKSGSDRYFMLINDNNTVLMDMKLTGYDNQTVSGVQALGVANNTTGVKIINVQVDGCSTTSTLGGYPVEIGTGCTVLLNGGGVTCNTWDAGGGIHIAGSTTSVTISNYQFIGNYQLFNNGTALKISSGTVNIYNSRFESNTIGGDKSGVGIDVTTGTVNVYDSYFYKNQTNILSNNIGGAVSVHGGIFRITRSVFSGNVPQPATSGIYGAGIGVTGGTVSIDSCGFTGNVGARANDVYVNGGNVLTRNCTFGSAANQIGIAGGTFSIATCGAPSEYGAGIFHINTNPPTYTAAPQLPDYLPVTCVVIPCTTPVITSAAPTSTLCSGGNFSTNLTASTTSAQTTYSWFSSAVAGINGHSTSGVNNINETLVNTTTVAITVTYSVTPTFNLSCNGSTVVYSVTVYPTPTISVASSNICSGNSATVSPTGTTTYTLLPLNITGSTFVLTPSVSSTYTLNGTANGCAAGSTAFSITVNSTPTISLSSITNTVICNGNNSVITPGGASSYTLLPGNSTGTSFTVTPASSTIYTINGTSSNGCASANSLTVPVNVNPTPTISLLSVSNPTLCAGNNSVIQPTGASTYTLQPGNQTGTSFTVTPTSTTTYTILGSNSFGCVAANNATTTILVVQNPTISLASITNTALCQGDSAIIVPSGASTYTLLPNLSTGNSFTITPGSTSVYTISGSNTAGCLSINSPTFQLTVNPLPIISISSNSNPVLCLGDSSIITPNGASSYTLLPLNSTGSTFTVTPSASSSYSVLGSSSAGCLASNMATVSVVVNNNPTVTLNAVPNASICSGTSITLVPSGANTYTLVPGNLSGNSFTLNPVANTTYSLSGTSSAGCLSQNTATVGVFIYSSITLTTSVSSPVVCTNEQYTLNVSSTSSPVTYTWSGNGINASNQNLNNPVINAAALSAGVYVYTVMANSAEGCTSLPYTATVNIITQPNSSFSLSPLSLCQNAQGVLMIDNPQTGVSYTWNVNGNTLPGTYSLSITSGLTSIPGLYTVSVLAGLSTCSNTSSQTLTVNALPTVQLSANNYTACVGSNYIVNITNPLGNSTYNWYFGNNNIGSGLSYNLNNLSQASAGIYSVTVTDANTCKATATVSIDVINCLVFVPEIFTPNSDGKNDTFEIKHIEDYPNNNLKIFNRWGNLIYEKNGYKNEFDGHANIGDQIGSEKLPAGTYYVFLIFNDGKTTDYTGILQLQY